MDARERSIVDTSESSDAHAGRVHAANDPERAYVIFGNHEFGLPPGDTMV